MLQGRVRAYEWGSLRAIPELFGKEAAEGPVAEVWLGAHPDDPASVGRVHSIFDESQLYPSRVAPRAAGRWALWREPHAPRSRRVERPRESACDGVRPELNGSFGAALWFRP